MNELQAAAAVGPDGPGADVRDQAARARHRHRPGAAHPRRPGRPRALPECALHPAHACCALGVVPVINENDTVVNDEIKFGDNDTLGALVANLVEADAAGDPHRPEGPVHAPTRARTRRRSFVHEARAGDPALEAMAGGAGSSIGKRRHDHQDPGGQARGRLGRLHRDRLGPRAGLRCCAWRAARPSARCWSRRRQKSQARKHWMADHLQLRGAVTVDAGAAAKVRAEGKSLLPIGMTAVEGDFSRGDVIAVRDPAGAEIARGLANYAARRGAPAVPQAFERDRAAAGLRGRAGDDPPRQPGADALSARALSALAANRRVVRRRADLRTDLARPSRVARPRPMQAPAARDHQAVARVGRLLQRLPFRVCAPAPSRCPGCGGHRPSLRRCCSACLRRRR